jgi:hypothetical protein
MLDFAKQSLVERRIFLCLKSQQSTPTGNKRIHEIKTIKTETLAINILQKLVLFLVVYTEFDFDIEKILQLRSAKLECEVLKRILIR